MNEIFISYKREDQPIARKLAEALETEGWSVWWDPELRTGEHFDEIIEAALQRSRCVIVLWSARSLQSSYVRDEATYALEQKKLVPVAIENVDLPFRFRRVHTLKLIGWNGSRDTREFQKLIEDISALFRGSSDQPPTQLTSFINRTNEVRTQSLNSSYRKYLLPLAAAAALVTIGFLFFWFQKGILPRTSEPITNSPPQENTLPVSPNKSESPLSATPDGQRKQETVVESSSLIVSGGGGDLYRVYDSSGQKQLGNRLTGTTIELLPGDYQIVLNGTRQTVTVQAKRRTLVESGSLIVSGGGKDVYRVYDSSGQKLVGNRLTGNMIEMLPGDYQVVLNGTRQTVTVQAKRRALVESGSLIVSGGGKDVYRVYDSSAQKQLGNRLTGNMIELLPGSYYVELNQSKVPVQVRAREKTTL